MKIGIIGIGCVGNAIKEDFTSKGIEVIIYDKYKNGGIGQFEDTLICDLIFLCLPTPYDYSKKSYNKDSIYNVCYYYSLKNQPIDDRYPSLKHLK